MPAQPVEAAPRSVCVGALFNWCDRDRRYPRQERLAVHVGRLWYTECLQNSGGDVDDRYALGDDLMSAVANPQQSARVVIAATHRVDHVEELGEPHRFAIAPPRDGPVGKPRVDDVAATEQRLLVLAAHGQERAVIKAQIAQCG